MTEKQNLLIPSAVVGVSLVVCSVILGGAVGNLRNQDQTISVTGSAKKRIKADLVSWTASVTRQAPNIVDAYKLLGADLPSVKQFVTQKGVLSNEITMSSISSTPILERTKDGIETGKTLSYQLTQSIEVKSKDVDKIEKLATEVTELMAKGIPIQSGSPKYFCSNLSDLKKTMLAEAAKDAKVRAEMLAGSTGSVIGNLRTARMDPLQITKPDSNEVSDYGINDVSSVEKDITAVVNATFSLK